jgi:RHS repeat-associated protein
MYTLDGAGNITKRVVNGTTTTMAYNLADEICWMVNAVSTNACGMPPAGATSYTFDPDGNELGSTAGLSLAYDARNETSSITSGGTANPLTYLGGEELLTAIGPTTISNNLLGISGQTAGGHTTSDTRDVHGTLMEERTPSGIDTYVLDGLDSVVALTSPTGGSLDTATYDPYGQVTASSGTTPNPFTFAGGLQAPGGLIKYGARYYDPSLGRWTQQDPMTSLTDLNDGNPYAYVGDDPIDLSDPTGLCFIVSCSVYHAAGTIASGAVKGGITGAETGFVTGLVGGDPIGGAAAAAAAGAVAGGASAAAEEIAPGSGQYVDDAFTAHDFYKDFADAADLGSKAGS